MFTIMMIRFKNRSSKTKPLSRNFTILRQQIRNHPDYYTKLSDETRWVFEISDLNTTKNGIDATDSKWTEALWNYLYLNQSDDKYNFGSQ